MLAVIEAWLAVYNLRAQLTPLNTLTSIASRPTHLILSDTEGSLVDSLTQLRLFLQGRIGRNYHRCGAIAIWLTGKRNSSIQDRFELYDA